jgi:bifunctional enzyme CysN/CysC
VREKAADVVGRERFLVVHVDCPVDICRQRDSDGHYKLADSGEIALFPGVSAPYEPPTAPDLRLETATLGVDECVEQIVGLLEQRGVLR